VAKRHKWAPNPDWPDREDLRVCLREGCGMHRRDFGPERYEYRTADSYKFIANRKKQWAAPPCEGK
jgi:hypothetical protein